MWKGRPRLCFEEKPRVESTRAWITLCFLEGLEEENGGQTRRPHSKKDKGVHVVWLRRYSTLALLVAILLHTGTILLALVLHVVSKTGCVVLNCVHQVHQRKGKSCLRYCRVV